MIDIFKNAAKRPLSVTTLVLGLTGCATGLPTHTPQSQAPEHVGTTPRGIQVYYGTNEPLPVTFNACRDLSYAMRQLDYETRNARKYRPSRRGRNDGIDDIVNRKFGDLIEGISQAGVDAGVNAAKRTAAQGRIDALSSACQQQIAREAWEQSVLTCTKVGRVEATRQLRGAQAGVPLAQETYNETCVEHSIGNNMGELQRRYGF